MSTQLDNPLSSRRADRIFLYQTTHGRLILLDARHQRARLLPREPPLARFEADAAALFRGDERGDPLPLPIAIALLDDAGAQCVAAYDGLACAVDVVADPSGRLYASAVARRYIGIADREDG